MSLDIDYKVVPTFSKVHRETNPFIFVMGPVGSGKSTGCIFHAFINAMRQKPDHNGIRHSRHLVVRATYPSLRASTIKSWIMWFKDKITITYSTPIVGRIRYPMEDGTTVDMEVLFIAVDDDQAVEKLRSLEVTSCHINEAAEVSFRVFEMLKTRFDRYPAKKDGGCVNPFIILDYNAVSTDHWLYKIAEETKPEGCAFYKQPSAVIKLPDGRYIINQNADNVENLSEDYYKLNVMGADEDFVNVNVMNNYGEVRTGRPVYKDYSDGEHHSPDAILPLREVPVIIGVDQGLTPAAVFTQQAPDGRVLVFDEIATEDCSLQEFCQEHLWPLITTKYPWIVSNFQVVCDPAIVQRSMNDAKAGFDILKENGLPVKLAKSNVFTERKEAVIHFLRLRDKFKLGPCCVTLRKGFLSEYKFDEARTVNGILYKEKPAKNKYSHVHDALQYAMMEYVHKQQKRRPPVSRKKYQVASSIGGY